MSNPNKEKEKAISIKVPLISLKPVPILNQENLEINFELDENQIIQKEASKKQTEKDNDTPQVKYKINFKV